MGWILPLLECDRMVPLLVFSKTDSWRKMERVMRGGWGDGAVTLGHTQAAQSGSVGVS